MRLNSINPKDNPMEEVLYCFGGKSDAGGTTDDAYEAGSQQTGQGATGSDADDTSETKREKVAKEAGVPASTMVGSGPRGGNVVTSGDGSPVKSSREVEKAAEEADTTVEEINRRINDAYEAYSFDPGFDDSDVADTSALDEIAAEFDFAFSPEQAIAESLEQDTNYSFDPESIREQGIAESLRQDYSAVFDQATTRDGQKINVDPDASTIQSTAGQAEGVTGGRSKAAKRDSSTERSLAIEDLVTAYQSSVFPDQLLGGRDPQNLIDQVEGRGTVGDQRPLSIPEIQNITAELLKNPANRETIDGYALADLEASVKPETTTDLINLYETDPREALRFVTLGGVDGKLQSQRYAKTYLESLQKAQDEGRLPSQTQKIGSDLVDDLDPRLFDLDEQADLLDNLSESTVATESDDRSERLAQARVELGLPEDATAEDILNALNARKATNADVADIVIQIPDEEATVQRNPVMGFSPYEQLSTIDPETGERVALDFRTSLGGPDNFGEVDFGKFGEPINVFGADVPTALGVAESILNTFIDPTGTTERAVYEGGVRSVDGRATGLDTGIDLVTDGTQRVIGGYDRDRNIVYATEGNLFNPALSDFYEEKRRVDDAARDDGDQARPLAGGLEILPQSTLSAYDFGSSSFDPFSTEAGTGVGSGTGSIDSLPAVGAPAFDFMRDFGAFTLSPQPDQMPEGAYSPTYLAPISEMTAEERQGLVGLLGTPLGAELGLSDIDLGQTPTESAEALIRGLSGDQSV